MKFDERKEVYDKQKKEPTPNMPDAGYPEKDVKTSGIKQRGNGAAVKGYTSRGPMA